MTKIKILAAAFISILPLTLSQAAAPIPVTDQDRAQIPDLKNREVPVFNLRTSTLGLINPRRESASFPVILAFVPGSGISIADMDLWMNTPGAAGCTGQICSYTKGLLAEPELAEGRVKLFIVSAQSPDEILTRIGQLQAAGSINPAAADHLKKIWLSDRELEFAKALGIPAFEVAGVDRETISRVNLVVRNGKIVEQQNLPYPADASLRAIVAACQTNK